MFNLFNLFKKVYCDICGRRIRGKVNIIPIAEDSDSCYKGKVCDDCASVADDYQIGE
jgi:ribosome-binding protein aMBF1 (putative translation factor)